MMTTTRCGKPPSIFSAAMARGKPRESEEETGFHIGHVEKVFEAFMSPGAVTERLYFYIGEYEDKDRLSQGGGKHGEGEDIEVLELPLAEALQKIRTQEIVDGKTIMLLQHLALSGRMKD